MATVSTIASRVKVKRSVTVFSKGPGCTVIRIKDGRKHDFYTVMPIACEIGGRAFTVEKCGIDASCYAVRIGAPADCSCECKGFLHRHSCRHVLSLTALDKAGQL